MHPAHGGTGGRVQTPAYGYDAPPGYGDPHGYAAQGYAQGYGTPPGYGAPVPPHDPHDIPPAAADDLTGLGRALNILGAVVSVALIVGLAIWGYKLAVRDVTGIPVVRALEGPMRIQPDDPGGAVAPHQGLAVNTVAATNGSAGPVDQVMLAPTPAGLAPDDVPAHPEAAVSAAPSVAEAPAVIAASATVTVPEFDTDAAVAEALAMADDMIDGLAPLSEAEAVEVIPASVPGVVHSPRPAPRPARLEAVAAVTSNPAAAEDVATGTEVASTGIAAGTRLVQLGAYESTDLARSQWDQIAARFPELFDGRDYVIEEAQSGGKSFYRLRTMGFDDLADARRFCAALMASNTACIPVVMR